MIRPNSSGVFIEDGDFDSQFELRRNYKGYINLMHTIG